MEKIKTTEQGEEENNNNNNNNTTNDSRKRGGGKGIEVQPALLISNRHMCVCVIKKRQFYNAV